MTPVWLLASAALLLGLLFTKRGYWAWVASGGVLLLGWAVAGSASWAAWLSIGLPFGALALLMGRPEWRRRWPR